MRDIAIYGTFHIWKTMCEDGRKSVWKGAYGQKEYKDLSCSVSYSVFVRLSNP